MKIDAQVRQKQIYINGFGGIKPCIPTDFNTLAAVASQSISRKAFNYIAGGAGLETTIQTNLTAFERHKIIPRMLQGNGSFSLDTTLFNSRYPYPIHLCPIGVLELAHKFGDLAIAEACKETGLTMMVSNQASHPMEEIAKVLHGSPWMFQLYVSKSDQLVESFVKRAEQTGAQALVITLDTTLLGWRNRDLNDAYLPFLHGKGIAQYTSDPVFKKIAESNLEMTPSKPTLNSISNLIKASINLPGSFKENISGKALKQIRTFTQIYSRADLDWKAIDQIRSYTQIPVILKGILNPLDALLAKSKGIDAIYISNHGGRQVDGGISSLECIEPVRKTVGPEIPILFDSGIRCGADIMKALALGADSIGIGRPYVYALAVKGSHGVIELIQNMISELELTLRLAGISNLKQLSKEILT